MIYHSAKFHSSICILTSWYWHVQAQNRLYKIQATEVTDRKRKNFGKEKFNCCGILYIHRNLNYFSIFFKHIIAHQEYLDVCVNGEILDEIKEKARLMTPSQIYKQLLSANHDNEKMRNITISQIR